MERESRSIHPLLGLLLVVPGIIMLLIFCSAPFFSKSASLAGGLRGGRILIVELPQQDSIIAQIDLRDDKTATHALYSQQHLRASNTMTITDDLWNALEILRQNWCTIQPTFPPPASQRSVYEVAIQCGRIVNPEFRISADQLPRPLVELIANVPPPGES